jgi:putative Holliday junction resolvase
MAVGRLMALDVGDRRVGIAVSDPLALFARPLTTIERTETERDIAAIAELAAELETVRLIVGHPLLPSGDRGEQALRTEAIVAELKTALDVPIELWDESYSTLAARERLAESGADPATWRSRKDEAAAAVILEEWLREHSPPARMPLEDEE